MSSPPNSSCMANGELEYWCEKEYVDLSLRDIAICACDMGVYQDLQGLTFFIENHALCQ